MKLKTIVTDILFENANDRAQFALGYRAAQKEYVDDNIRRDFYGFSEMYVKGYKQGIRDARLGRVNDAILRVLTGLGDFLGRWNIGSRG